MNSILQTVTRHDYIINLLFLLKYAQDIVAVILYTHLLEDRAKRVLQQIPTEPEHEQS